MEEELKLVRDELEVIKKNLVGVQTENEQLVRDKIDFNNIVVKVNYVIIVTVTVMRFETPFIVIHVIRRSWPPGNCSLKFVHACKLANTFFL